MLSLTPVSYCAFSYFPPALNGSSNESSFVLMGSKKLTDSFLSFFECSAIERLSVQVWAQIDMKSEFHLFLVFSVFLTTLPQLDGFAIPNHEHERKKVLILGAGAAGITAAMTLYDQGITDFLVLEAQDYVGGRIKSVPFAGKNIEEGANWIHFVEEKENPLLPLRDKYNLTGHLSNYSDFCMR